MADAAQHAGLAPEPGRVMNVLRSIWASERRGITALVVLAIVAASLALGLGSSPLFGIPLMALAFAAAIASPISAAAIAVSMIPFAFNLHELPAGSFSLLELAIVWTVAGAGVPVLARPRAIPARVVSSVTRYPWITVAAVGLASATAVSIVFLPTGSYRAEAFREVRLVVLEPLAFIAALLLLGLQARERAWMATGLIVGGVLASLIALAQVFEPGAGVVADGLTRLTGPYTHPNNLALYLERIGVFAAAFALLCRRRLALVVIAALTIVAAALVMTFSRGGWLGAAAGVGVILVVLERFRWLVFAAIAAIVVAIPSAFIFRERLFDLGGASDEPTRFAIWRSSREMILDHPWTGVGPDQFLYQYGRRYVEPIGWPERYTSHPHHVLLDFAVRFGAGGIIALVSMAGAVVAGAAHRLDDLRRDPIRLGALGALAAGGVHGLIDNSYFLPDLALMFWVFLLLLWSPAPLGDEGA